jgi:hypothetical protein
MHIAPLGLPAHYSLINFLVVSPRHVDWQGSIFYLLLWVYVAFLWVRWTRRVEKVNPKWQAVTAFAGESVNWTGNAVTRKLPSATRAQNPRAGVYVAGFGKGVDADTTRPCSGSD